MGENLTLWGSSVVGNFHDQPAIQRAMWHLELWATCRHHKLQGCSGEPTLDWINEGDESKMLRMIRRDLEPFDGDDAEWASLCRQGRAYGHQSQGITIRLKRGRLGPWETFFGSDEEWDRYAARGLTELKEQTDRGASRDAVALSTVRLFELSVEAALSRFQCPAARPLLMHLYPTVGPYGSLSGDLQSYRPEWLMGPLGSLADRADRSINPLLREIERGILREIAWPAGRKHAVLAGPAPRTEVFDPPDDSEAIDLKHRGYLTRARLRRKTT